MEAHRESLHQLHKSAVSEVRSKSGLNDQSLPNTSKSSSRENLGSSKKHAEKKPWWKHKRKRARNVPPQGKMMIIYSKGHHSWHV